MKFVTKHPVAASVALLFIVAVSFSLLRTKLTPRSVENVKSLVEETEPEDMSEIVGGRISNTARWPYFCLLGAYNTNGGFTRLCGASLVHDDMVLTAAHCLYDRNGNEHKFMSVFCNVDDSFNPDNPTRGFTGAGVAKTFPNKDYNPATIESDTALLKLSGPLDGIPKVTLNRDSLVPSDRQALLASGFGFIRTHGPDSDVLREVDLTNYNNDICLHGFDGFKGDVMMCAHKNAEGICFGDSGGPLVIPGSDSSSDVQVGLTSFVTNRGCADLAPIFTDYFARVSAWYDEIVRIVCSESARASTSPLCSSGSGSGSGTCHDVPGWLDSHGTSCSWYAQGNLCEVFGTLEMFRNEGKRAKEACCACGGGVRN